MVTGAIIAGGRSRRFGEGDKAVTPLAGRPMIRRIANRLAGTAVPVDPGGAAASDGEPVVDAVLVNCRSDQREAIEAAMEGYPLDVRYVEDEEPDLGPMAGIGHVCREAPDDLVAVVACDMPFVDPTLLESLAARADERSVEAVVPRLNDEWLQTTQAIYRAEPMATACDRALDRGDRRILEALFELEYLVVEDEEIAGVTTERTFENVNTRAELERVEQRYRTA